MKADTTLHDCFSVQTPSHEFQHINKLEKPHKAEKTFFLDILPGTLTTDLIFHSKTCGEVRQQVAKLLAELC